ncbi:MAG: S1C family serine protease [Planctomycetaceae bacterium]|nr:S1C family serine protease [Planctomycetaceae bacterium]
MIALKLHRMSRFVLFFSFLLLTSFCAAADISRAVQTVAPYLVRIETIGGHERIGNPADRRERAETLLANEGTSTGILLDQEGYIITAAFNFLHDPTSILLIFPDGTKKVARKIATDRLRMLTLLKAHDFSAGEIVPLPFRTKESLHIGERCMAVGIVFAGEANVALGIISGKDRIWGKALQTDAAIGPNNYGGLLMDMSCNVLGIPVPLSMTARDITAGADMYDAGVGLAIPWEDMLAALPKLKEGKDLLPGSFGFGFRDNQTFIGEPMIARVQADSLAAVSGLRPGDRIVSIDGVPMPTALAVTQYIRQRYACESLSIVFLRDGVEQTVLLAEPQS